MTPIRSTLGRSIAAAALVLSLLVVYGGPVLADDPTLPNPPGLTSPDDGGVVSP